MRDITILVSYWNLLNVVINNLIGLQLEDRLQIYIQYRFSTSRYHLRF